MELQSTNRPEPFPADVREYFTPQPEPQQARRFGGAAIDAVRAAGWHDYDRTNDPEKPDGSRYPQSA